MFASRRLLLSCLLAVSMVSALQPRQSLTLGLPGQNSASASTQDVTTTQQQVTTTQQQVTTTQQTTTQQETTTTQQTTTQQQDTTTQQTTTQQTTTTPTTTQDQQTTTTPTTTQDTQTQPQTTAPPQTTKHVLTTDVNGDEITVTVTNTSTTSSATGSSASASSSSAADNNKSDSSGLGTGSIVGIAVAGGIALLGLIAFIVWKFTRKRFTDFDDNEAIKWPELNSHGDAGGVAMPTHNTNRAGFDTESTVSLSRAPSQTGTNYSTPDLGADPYAVPPLPHLNPGQPMPYHDDPNAAGGAYYDPYRGPVPNTLGPGGEAYPMTQMGGGPAAYDMAQGRASPAPTHSQAAFENAMGRAMSPAPAAAYGRAASPGPQMAYGRASPGPGAAYGAPR